MWIKEPGKINDNIYFLGTYDICLHLVKGKDAMIIGGGMSYIAPSLEEQFSEMEFDPNRIKYLVIPHSHFDHCGAVPYLKRKFPDIKVVASKYTKELLSKTKVVDFIADTNKKMIEKCGLHAEYERLNLQIDGIHVDQVVGDSDIIDLGDSIEAHFIEVPGHSKCCVATYIPHLKAMFPSDAVPLPPDYENGAPTPSAQYDFSLYLESLRKLVTYEVEICGLDHYGIFIGNQAKDILQRGLETTEKFGDYVLRQYQATGDLDKLALEISTEIMKKNNYDYMDTKLMFVITRAMLRSMIRWAL